MEEGIIDYKEDIDTLITELKISKNKGNLILSVVNSPVYRNRIINSLKTVFQSKVIKVEEGKQIIDILKRREFNSNDILIWIMPEKQTEEILNTLNNFRELFYEAKIPNLIFFNQAFFNSVIRDAPDFWRYRGGFYEFYYELKEEKRGLYRDG